MSDRQERIIKEFIQFLSGVFLLNILKVFWIFPIKRNRIFFTSYKGKQYSCNPKYVYEYLYHQKKFDLIWGIKRRYLKDVPEYVKAINLLSVRGLYLCLTSKVIIDNFGMFPYIPYRKKQYCINTWHGGGAYKRIDNITLGKSKYKIYLDQQKARATNMIVLSCRDFEMVADSLMMGKRIDFARIGMPRNDLLFNECVVERRARHCKERLGIEIAEKVILYAPTFRGEETGKDCFEISFDVNKILETAEQRYGGHYVFLIRAHHYLINRIKITYPNVIDVSKYSDVMELLCATDILITDYSSIMWDFALLQRPCFLYTPDLKEYSRERNYYVDIRKWCFPIAENANDLYRHIQTLSDEQAKRNAYNHHLLFGSYEKGNACEKLANIIDKVMEEK